MNQKNIKYGLIVLLFLVTTKLSSQAINLIRFNADVAYGVGSGVSVIINPIDTFAIHNKFILELSSPGGDWSNPQELTTVSEFYTPVINGIIPQNALEGEYKLRVRSTHPAAIVETEFFEINSSVNTYITAATSLLQSSTVYFNCLDCNKSSNTFGSQNQNEGATTATMNMVQRTLNLCDYSTDTQYEIELIDVNRNIKRSINHSNGSFEIPANLGIGTYVIEITTKKNNEQSVYSILFIFHGNATSLGNSSSEEICVGSSVVFNVDTSNSGIARNYMGSKYIVDFGDGTKAQELTQAQLLADSRIEHIYLLPSCSKFESSFYVQINLQSKGISDLCNTYTKNGNGVTKRVNASQPPEAKFQAPKTSCINSDLTITNNTIPGFYGTSGCKDASNFFWYYKKPNEENYSFVSNASWIDSENNLTLPASVLDTPGCWSIKLEAQNQDLCQSLSEMEQTVIIEKPEIATFVLSRDTVCKSDQITLTNTSSVLTNSCSNPKFEWLISDSKLQNTVAYEYLNGTNKNSQNINIHFNKSGTYDIILKVINECGEFLSTSKTVFVYGEPEINFAQNELSICASSPASYIVDFSLDQYKPSYNSTPHIDYSYTWTVSGDDVDYNDYSFINNTTNKSAYPVIKFNSFKKYQISVEIPGKCNTISRSDISITFNEMPVISNAFDQYICSAESTEDIVPQTIQAIKSFKWTVKKTQNIATEIADGNGLFIESQQFDNVSDSIGVVTYDVVALTDFCESLTYSFNVYVYPKTVMAQPADIVLCNSEQIDEQVWSSNLKNTTVVYRWYNSNESIGLPVSGTGNIPAFVAVNNENKAIQSKISVIPTSVNNHAVCKGETKVFYITVLPQVQLNAVDDFRFCNNEVFNELVFTTKNTDGNTRYSWSNSNSSIGLQASGIGNIPAFRVKNDTDHEIQSTITVVATYDLKGSECSSEPFSFQINVESSPKTIIAGSTNVCMGAISPEVVFKGIHGKAPYSFEYQLNDEPIDIITSTNLSDSISFTVHTNIAGRYVYKLISTRDSENKCINYTVDSAVVVVANNPIIKSNPIASQTICVGKVPETLEVQSEGGAGNSQVRWYRNNANSNNGGIEIEGAQSATFTPPAFNEVGSYYYYALISMDGSSCGLIVSEIAEINVVPEPVIESQALQNQTICQNSPTQTLKINVIAGISDFKYQWYRNTSNELSNAEIIVGATNAAYIPPSDSVAMVYYFCEISQDKVGCTIYSNISSVNTLEKPEICQQPLSYTLCKNDSLPLLNIEYRFDSQKPNYQWFSNTVNSNTNGFPILVANKKTLQITNQSIGVFYYYCQISFDISGAPVLVSETAKIQINPYPVISDMEIETASGLTFDIKPENNAENLVPENTSFIWSEPTIYPQGTIDGAKANSSNQLSISQTLVNNSTDLSIAKYRVTPFSMGCKGDDFELTVKVQPSITAIAKINNIKCFGANNGEITVEISGGFPFKIGNSYNLQWAGPDGFASTESKIYKLYPGTYQLLVTDSIGLEYRNEYLISDPMPINIQIDSVENVSCFAADNGFIHINTTGGTGKYFYSWTKDGQFFSDKKDIDKLQPAEYSLIVTDENDCSASSMSIKITEPAKLIISETIHINNLCFGDNIGAIEVSVEGGTPDYTYSWIGPNGFTSNAMNISNLYAGDYILTVTDALGCTSLYNIQITQNTELTVAVETTQVSCYGRNDASIKMKVSGGKEPYSAKWKNLASGFEQNNLSPGVYDIKIEDALGCSKNISIQINQDTIFYIEPEIKNVSCFGANDGSIKLNISSKQTHLKLRWSDGSSSGNERNNLKAGIYSVEIDNGSPCVINETFVITEPEQLVVSANITHIFDCNQNKNTNGTIDLNVYGGKTPYQFSWSNGMATEDLSNLNAGVYYVTIVDSNSCSVTEAFEVIRPLPLKVEIDSKIDFNCSENQVRLINTAKINGGVPPYQVSWSEGETSGPGSNQMTSDRNMTVFVTVTDAVDCSKTIAFNNEVPETGVKISTDDCDNMVYSFDIDLPDTYTDNQFEWEFGDGSRSNAKNPTHIYMSSGTYQVKLHFNNAQCSSIFKRSLVVEALPELTIDQLPMLCPDDSLLITVSGAKTYKWNDGSVSSKKMINKKGLYTVVGKSSNGCTSSLQFNAEYFSNYQYKIYSDKDMVTTENPTVTFWTSDTDSTEYYWDFGDSGIHQMSNQSKVSYSFDIKRSKPINVKLVINNPNGCEEIAEKRIWLLTSDLPNTFTPNGDGVNDKFLEGYDLEVYNANGIILYKGNEGWDGTYKGKVVARDTYYYIIQVQTPDGIEKKPGYITVIK